MSGSRNGSGARALTSTLRALALLILVLVASAGLVVFSIARRGLSAHEEPSAVEAMLAGAMRRWATPSAVRERSNPLPPSEVVVDEALGHYADHCAGCHGNDGSGDTQIGRGLYPKAPDMRQSGTQSLTDGELFWIIEHGIRLTGMPGWTTGTPEGERASWGLVHFIRRLPKLTAEEIERVDGLTPRTREQLEEEERARRFLAGENVR
jgi:mono/diheme cytochrome c family protein